MRGPKIGAEFVTASLIAVPCSSDFVTVTKPVLMKRPQGGLMV